MGEGLGIPSNDAAIGEEPWVGGLSDVDLLTEWESILGQGIELKKERAEEILAEILYRPMISIHSQNLSPDELEFVLGILDKTYKDGVFFPDSFAKAIYSGTQKAVVRPRDFYEMKRFHVLVSKTKGYGYIRFREPDLLTRDEVLAREEEHSLTKADLDKYWKGKTHFYLHQVRDFIPFPKPINIDPIEGQVVFIPMVKKLGPSDDFDGISPATEAIVYEVDLLKVDEDLRLVTGVVLAPEITDLQGDVISEEEVRKTMVDFVKSSRMIDVQHDRMNWEGLSVVETYQAPVDFSLGDSQIVKGSWVMTVEVLDDKVWDAVKRGMGK